MNVANIDAGNKGQTQNNGRKRHRQLLNNMISAQLLDASYTHLGLRDGFTLWLPRIRQTVLSIPIDVHVKAWHANIGDALRRRGA